MGFKAPSTPAPEKAPDPLINLGETSANAEYQKNKRGLLSTFLQANRANGGGMFQGLGNKKQTLGSSTI